MKPNLKKPFFPTFLRQTQISLTMKKHLFLSAFILAAGFRPIFSQVNWGQLPLTGATAKIIAATPPGFCLSLSTIFPIGETAPINNDNQALHAAAFAPGTAEQLFEKFGGPFTLDNPSGQKQTTFEMEGSPGVIPGLQLGIRLGRRFEINAAIQQFKSNWSGVFPVTVFSQNSHDQTQPATLQGSMRATASGLLLRVGATFFVTNGRFRPYLSGGINGQFPLQTASEATIAGISLPLKIEPVATTFSPFGEVGGRWDFWKNAFLSAGCSFGKWPGSDFGPAVTAGVGWGF